MLHGCFLHCNSRVYALLFFCFYLGHKMFTKKSLCLKRLNDVTYELFCYIGAKKAAKQEPISMEKRYNFRLYPTKEQEAQIQRNFGCVRWVYNHFLNESIERYKAGEPYRGYFENCLILTKLKQQEENKWLYAADANSLQFALKTLDIAYTEFFRRLREGTGPAGFPNYKSKKETRQSYKSAYAKAIALGRNTIKLPKLGQVACRVSKEIEGRIISATVCQTPSGKYYVSICVTDFEPAQLEKTGKTVGLVPDAANLAAITDGENITEEKTTTPPNIEKSKQKIAKLQRELSRKTSGSANREKARLKLARAHEKLKNQKTDHLHKLTTQLVRDYDAIYISGNASPEMKAQLEYKCGWYGRELGVRS